MAALDGVCRRLDDLAVAFFEALDELEETRKKYSKCCSEGYFGLTQARYAMGVNAVSQLQYDTTMTALSHVSVVQEEEEDSFTSGDTLHGSTVFSYYHTSHPRATGENAILK
jgi:hypothetical protein